MTPRDLAESRLSVLLSTVESCLASVLPTLAADVAAETDPNRIATILKAAFAPALLAIARFENVNSAPTVVPRGHS